MRFSTLLVANRGEIAVRILQSARRLGYRSVAVYSDADANAPHVRLADAAVRLGPAPALESYLCMDKVLAAARATGAEAIHPGYGFLAENPAFARACAEAGLQFIGPSADAMEKIGNKQRARLLAREVGVPCVPGYDGADQSLVRLTHEAEQIGFPLLIKAAAGGGGRGMRRVEQSSELAAALERARSEAARAFGSEQLLLERAVDGAHHVEVQFFADERGNRVHLGERDCSVQRRFQKIIEEAPSPIVDAALRERMGSAALRLVEAAGYAGAGTAEFLLTPQGEFYFLEVNARLQVEHPVTELVTGLDLVELQLAIAQGEALPVRQQDVRLQGHAIELRLCAEDPAQGFLPQTGRLQSFEVPAGIRVDHALEPDIEITPFYDSMIAKLIAYGPNREIARRSLQSALERLRLAGVTTNRALLGAILADEDFIHARVDTRWTERVLPRLLKDGAAPPGVRLAAIAALYARDVAQGGYSDALAGFSNTTGLGWRLVLEERDTRHAVRITAQNTRERLAVVLGDERFELELCAAPAGEVAF
ncbi:MAG TPA: biotin carboxylase N-terminal domain-containing protein, partial [Polyangiales bacterium]|nr:biotin carboxylase N-terminal domain-containing protein [Polyangiales bacterium]